jgi:hypothetical protein
MIGAAVYRARYKYVVVRICVTVVTLIVMRDPDTRLEDVRYTELLKLSVTIPEPAVPVQAGKEYDELFVARPYVGASLCLH